jgi:hypothetical protein
VRKSAAPSLPCAMPMISMRVSAGGGGGGKSGKLFISGGDGDPRDDDHICINFIFEILPPPPSPFSKPKNLLGNSGGAWGAGGGEATFSAFDGNVLLPAVTCRSMLSQTFIVAVPATGTSGQQQTFNNQVKTATRMPSVKEL